MIKRFVRRFLERRGLKLLRRSDIPFGVDWCSDIAYLAKSVSSIRCCFDVGANLGQTASRLAEAFPEAEIHSFEPVPETYSQLKTNVTGNRLVRPHNIALSDKSGRSRMLIADESGRNRVENIDDPSAVVVQLETVDNFCRDHALGECNLLKIDVEGHELQVLRGAERMLRGGSTGFVVCECDFHPRPSEPHGNFFELTQYLNEFNYRVVSFYTGGIDKNGWVWGDVLFAHDHAIRRTGVSCSPAQ